MKNLNVLFVVFCSMCAFLLNGCINGGSSSSSPAAAEPAATKPVDATLSSSPSDATLSNTTPVNNNTAAPKIDILLKPRDTAPTNLQKITMKNGLVVYKPILENPNEKNSYNKAMIKSAEKAQPIGKPYFRALVKSNSKDGRKIRILVKNRNGVIGLPYDSFEKSVIPQATCLSDDISMVSANPNAETTFEEYSDLSSLSSALGGSLGIEASLGPIASVSATGMFMSSSDNNARSTNIYYIFRYNELAQIKGVSYRTNNAQSGLRMNYAEAPEAFRDSCGDGFVSKANAGVLIIVRLKFSFDSTLAKEEFDLALRAQVAGGLADVTAKITGAMKQTNQKTSLTIEAMQQGGTPQQLPRIMGASVPKDAPMGVAIIDCAVGTNVDKTCADTISNIVSYAKTVKTQIDGPKSYFYDQMEPTSYLSGVGLDMKPGDTVLEKKIDLFSAKYEQAVKYLQYLSDFNSRYSYARSTDLVGQLEVIFNKLDYQINEVFNNDDLKNECYSGKYPTSSCSQALMTANRALARDDVKLQPDEVQLLTHYLPHQQFRVGGLGLWRGDVLKRGVCNLIPVTTAQDTNVALHLDCGLGNDNPQMDIVASSISENQIIIDDFSYMIGQPEVEVKCLASDGRSSKLIFDVDETGDTYTASGVKCYVDGVEYTDPYSKNLVLQRIRY